MGRDFSYIARRCERAVVTAYRELRDTGKVKGAVHVPRGLLEFKADPQWPAFNKDVFGATERPIYLYCATSNRSALSGHLLKELGYKNVVNAGCFKDLAAADIPIERM